MHLVTNTTAFLIDADNLSPAAVEEAFAKLANFPGSLTVRRAYGGAEKLAGLREVLHRHAVRAFVNHGKGTTDVALAVDAIDLLHQVGPAVIAIGSGDGDFVPLVVRLREAGVRVLCFAQAGKAADDIAFAYDAVLHVGAKAQGTPAASAQAVAAQPAPSAAASPSPSAPRSVPAPAPRSGRSATGPADRAAPTPAPAPAAGSANPPAASGSGRDRGRKRRNGSRGERRSDASPGTRTDTAAETRHDGRNAARHDASAEDWGDTRNDMPPEARSIFPAGRLPEPERSAPAQPASDDRKEARPTVTPAPAAVVAAPVPAPVPAPAPAPETASAPAPSSPAPAERDRDTLEQVRRLLAAIPDWEAGATKQLNALGTPLQDAGLRKGGKPLHELFRKFPAYFEVLPRTGQARQVRLLQQPA